jgi:HlyD family secretion protein
VNFLKSGSIKKFKSGVKWIAWSAVLAIASVGGWLIYSWSLNRPSVPVEVRLIAVEQTTVEDLINESGIVELRGQQTLKSPVDGTVERVLVNVGDRVKSGQTLVILRDPERQTALAKQQLEIQKQELKLERSRHKVLEAVQKLKTAQRQLRELATEKVEIRKLELQLARNREKVLEDANKLEAARQELQELEVLDQRGFIPKNELQEQKDQILVAQSQLQDAELAVSTTALEVERLQKQRQSKQQELSEQVVLAQSQLQDAESEVSIDSRELERLKLDLQKIEQEIQNNLVRATIQGIAIDIEVKAGDVVELGDALLSLGDSSQVLVKLQLSPIDAIRVQVNQVARVKVIGSNAESFTGRVQSVAKLATSPGKEKESKDSTQATVTVMVKLDRPSQILIPGSKVDVEIVLAKRENVVALGREVIQGSGSDAFVWGRDSQGRVKKRPITLGLEGLTTVEVTSGLRPGDQVILPPAQSSLKPGMPVIVQGDK